MKPEFKFTTLKQAQAKYPDAIEAKLSHDPYAISKDELIEIGKNVGWREGGRVLFYKVGKCVSRVIVSRQAQIEFDQAEERFQQWLKNNDSQGKYPTATLRVIFDAMDDEDK